MKRIILFVLLFAALKVAGQTTGYLRYDTVRIMKQNGTAELYIMNKTKDTLGLLTNVGGGRTKFVKPRKINDTALVIGVDTIALPSGSGSTNLDSLRTDSSVTVVNSSGSDALIKKADTIKAGVMSAHDKKKLDRVEFVKNPDEMRLLTNIDTSVIYRIIKDKVIGDFYYDPNDVTTDDDTAITIVTATGKRLKRYIPDWIYDIRWFSAECDGVSDDTKPVKDALRLVAKYSGDRGGTIRLINNKFDPTDLVYPLGYTTFQLNGDIVLLHEWLLQGNIALIGESGTNTTVQFARGPKASIVTLDPDTDKAVLHCVGSGGFYENFNIVHPPGTGIWCDGWSPESGLYACSNKVFNNIGVLSNNTSASVDLRIEHGIWIYFNDCVFPCLNEASYAIKIQSVQATLPAYKDDMAGTGLIFFNGGVLAEKGFYIGGTADMGSAVGNIHVNDFIMEVPDSAIFTIDSRVSAVENVFVTNPENADAVHYTISNRGARTSKITVAGLFTIGGQDGVVTGDPITDLKVTGQPEFAFDAIAQRPIFRQYRQTKVEIDAINANKGWVTEIFRNPYGAVLQTNNTDTITGYRDPSGNHTAYRSTSTYRMYDNTVDLDSGDYVFAGGWVRSQNDSTLKSSDVSALVVSLNNATFDIDNSNFMNINPRLSAFEEQGWSLMYDIRRINSVTGTVTMNYELRPDAGNPLLLWKPFLMIIKDSLTRPAEVYAWAKEAIGSIESHVPKGARGIGDVGNFHIGDSTNWDWKTRKWYQTTLIPYASTDSAALLTFREAQRRYGSAGGGISGSGTTNNLVKFTGATSIGDARITDDGTNILLTPGSGQVACRSISSFGTPIFAINLADDRNLDLFSSNSSAVINIRKVDASAYGGMVWYAGTTAAYKMVHWADNTLRIAADGGSDNHIVLNSSGNVGIRTAPSANFHVSGSIRFDLTGDAEGDMFARSSTGVLQKVVPGTSGYVLTSNGAGAVASFQAPVAADGNGIYGGSGTLPSDVSVSGASHDLSLGTPGSKVSNLSVNSAGLIQLLGLVQLNTIAFTDADGSVTANAGFVKLPTITANRTITMASPSGGSGHLLIIWNANSSGNAWQFGGTSVIGPDGSSITNLTNDSVYMLIYDNAGTQWVKMN